MSALSFDGDVGRVLGGRYRLLAPIGVGSSAAVYLADDITLRRRVAVKVLHAGLADDPYFQRRFRAEAQAAASLNHPNVLGVYDWGNDGVPYLVAEHLEGGTLRSMTGAGHRLSVGQALMVGLEAARGLDYAHGRGLVHRDVKPANLLFDAAGRLRIADFGVARAMAEAGWTAEAGSLVGTARYAAPEQARGVRVGPPADVYAWALTINESICGEVPFTDDTVVGSLMARAEAAFEPHPDAGPMRPLLRRAGALEPSERPTAGELVGELLAVAAGLTRPDPLPLVPPTDSRSLPDLDPTRHGTLQVVPAPTTADGDESDASPARRWPWAMLLVTLVAAAVFGVMAQRWSPPSVDIVPDVAGQSRADALAELAAFGWELEIVEVREPGSVPDGVLGTDPEAGTVIESDEPLVVFVSLGEPLVVVPEVIGLNEAEARVRLEAAGLVTGEIQAAADETVPAGAVIEVIAPGIEVEPGTDVGIVVSTGPAPRIVPPPPDSGDLADAARTLGDLGLRVRQIRTHDEVIPAGNVVGFEPATGETVPVGTEITVFVSDGPAPRTVPDVLGSSVAEATARLEGEGFVVAGVQGSPALPVLATDPAPGDVVAKGTEVVIATSLTAD